MFGNLGDAMEVMQKIDFDDLAAIPALMRDIRDELREIRDELRIGNVIASQDLSLLLPRQEPQSIRADARAEVGEGTN